MVDGVCGPRPRRSNKDPVAKIYAYPRFKRLHNAWVGRFHWLLDQPHADRAASLGDIVVPGMFIAFALRYDLYRSKHQDSSKPFAKPLFIATLVSYVIGLVTTMVVMHSFQSAQPALLYLRFVSEAG